MEYITEIDETLKHSLIAATIMQPPYSLQANLWAMLLHRMIDISFADMAGIKKAQGYVGRGSMKRFETEFLVPTCAHFMKMRKDQQPEIDATVKALLATVDDRLDDSGVS
jgi:hypothetical protein